MDGEERDCLVPLAMLLCISLASGWDPEGVWNALGTDRTILGVWEKLQRTTKQKTSFCC